MLQVISKIFADPIVSLLGTNTDMVLLAGRALKLNALLFTTFGLQMVYATLYLAMGKSLAGSILSLSRQGIFFFPLIIILSQLLGLTGVISVQPMADLLTTAITIVFAVKIKKDISDVCKIETKDSTSVNITI